MKVRFKGSGIQYPPRLGRLVEDELIVEFEEALKKSPRREEILDVFEDNFRGVKGV